MKAVTGFVLSLLITTTAVANTQIVLKRSSQQELAGEYTGVVDLAIDPGFENAKVTVLVDGQKVADGLRSPYHVIVDFGPAAIQHKIVVQVTPPHGKRIQWQETINRGYLPLGVTVKAVDIGAHLFEAIVT